MSERPTMRDWLLHSPVQIASGPEAGAIAGWLDEAGRPSSAYGEITGYYLTWAAFVARTASVTRTLAARSERALAWLERQWRDATPPTRILLDSGMVEWRNRVVFTFDLAMILRGLSRGSTFLPAERCRAVAFRVLAQIEDLADPARGLASHRLRQGVDPRDVPETWSTRPGPHLVKAAAAILCAGDLPVSAALRAAAVRTLDLWRDAPAAAADLHPLFYRAEGLLMVGLFDGTAARQAEDLLAQVLAGVPGSQRGDVLAQALRLSGILQRRGPGRDAEQAALRKALERHRAADGAVCFSAEAPGRHHNAWASMFADQAVAWCEPTAAPLDPAELRLLV